MVVSMVRAATIDWTTAHMSFNFWGVMGCPCATQTANTQHLNHVKRKSCDLHFLVLACMLICLEHRILKNKCVCVCVWTFCGQLGNINLKYLLICELHKGVKGRIFPSGIPAYSEVESDQPSLVTNVTSQKGSAIERSTIHLSIGQMKQMEKKGGSTKVNRSETNAGKVVGST